uniref:Uncharacterized protein n=1 Tax=Medicago truncatula TaxID=3880 RepID=I3SED1_MEDTR|nr:unknown [Medicago truncatula]
MMTFLLVKVLTMKYRVPQVLSLKTWKNLRKTKKDLNILLNLNLNLFMVLSHL